ncbi:MAG: protein translocase subunit SecD [Bacteroidetes bacterium]|nr:protein translocase subunit SecD [Bacteroidota bacterium]
MRRREVRILIGIIVLVLFVVWVDWPANSGIHLDLFGFRPTMDVSVHQGLDLVGGLQVTLQANPGPDTPVNSDTMQAAKGIVESRVNALGVSEPLIQMYGDNRIIVELPGIQDPEQAIRTFGQTGLLEFIDAGDTPLAVGTLVTTTLGGPAEAGVVTPTPTAAPSPTVTPSPQATATGTGAVTSTAPVTPTIPSPTPAPAARVYTTVIQGKDLQSADVGFDQLGKPEIDFNLKPDGAQKFADYTRNNVGKYLAIAMDKRIISSPSVQSPITEGRGRITGNFTIDEARALVIQLKYGALPVPLKVVENRTVGPTLGQDSVHRSIIGGAIGLLLVVLFMVIYYRLPGSLASVALLIYAATTFALFKLIPVTLTLPGIAGFILSIGMAVDANILIFERMKEELRAGKTLGAAVEAGFSRAWTSIRDSNASTLITCVILFWFGSNFGASIVKGFALTLAIGVLVSLFTAVIVSRTFLRLLVGSGVAVSKQWFGLE